MDRQTVVELKYGCNPNQKPATLSFEGVGAMPLRVLNGQPGYINYLDALNAWQLVRQLSGTLNLPAAASFKHVSPAGAAVSGPLSPALKRAYQVEDVAGLDDSPLALAYARARGADRLCSFGDFVALSHPCDATTAKLIRREVSDGVIAPGYDKEALDILKQKRDGRYAVLEIDRDYEPKGQEVRTVFGLTLTQGYNDCVLDEGLLNNVVTKNQALPKEAARDLIVAMVTLKYTQSNSVCYVKDGQVIGNGAGQQSRVHCTRLAGNKADLWHLRQHERVLSLPFLPALKRPERDNAIDAFLNVEEEAALRRGAWRNYFTELPRFLTGEERAQYLAFQSGVALGSDAFFPFSDNIERARRSGVQYIVQPGGSVRDADVIAACDAYDMVMAFTGQRLFHH